MRRGPRRRTEGLRREEVAALCHLSTDYYARFERATRPQPSEQMIASIAQGLHLSLGERDYVFRLSDHNPSSRGASSEHISPGLLHILDRLEDTPAEIVTELGGTLRQTPMGIALTGDASRYQGSAAAWAIGGSPTRPCGRPIPHWSRRSCHGSTCPASGR